MRVLVTGAGGFVGRYLVSHLQERGDEVVAAGGPHDEGVLPIDLTDETSLAAALDIAQPDAIVHLAAQTFVPQSIDDPLDTYDVNVMGTARLLRASRDWRKHSDRNPRVLFTSSAEVYGPQPSDAFPLRETLATNPVNPYAASKAACESLMLGEARSYDLDVIITRAFNHIGPGQNDRFVVPGFAKQLACIARTGEGILYVGNLKAKRDFLDVRDVVRAYVALLENGKSGTTYNVCRGTAVGIDEVLRELINIARVPVEVREDPKRMRPSDIPMLYGDNARLRQDTGWEAAISLRESLRLIYDDAYKTEAAAKATE
ncbi:MAG: GDP-mannose 4,6-dehydratase [Candidatus Eremiobacteraeota bacterium]|nr:GDP-mannose 4,6-dehydratase [Candidatus Eremiobacteraeota bacterium]